MISKKSLLSLSILVVVTLVLAACTPDATETPQPQTIVDIAVADGRFTTLVAALQAADLVETLSGDGPFTVFAPTDDAFAKLPAGTVDALLADIPALTDILLYHVVPGELLADDVVLLDKAETLLGENIMIKVQDGNVFINDSLVVITDIVADNGVIHVVDTVLQTPGKLGTLFDVAMADGRFTTLVAAVQEAGLVEDVSGEGPFTVFAPTDDALAKLPAGTFDALLADIPTLIDILLYHAVPGEVLAEQVVTLNSAKTFNGKFLEIKVIDGNVFINDSQVIATDIMADNGVIHAIDTVLVPGESLGSIAELAVADGRFTTLVTALQETGLFEKFSNEGLFTVFAPTDDALAKLPEGTIEALLADIPALTDILLYHVVSGRLMADEVVALDEAETLLGEKVTIRVEDGKVFINDAQVIITDILADNGVIHVIDTVLLPPTEEPYP
jgi:transforming growth factor-beta-induced protein